MVRDVYIINFTVMKQQFCKVGNVRPNLKEVLSVKEFKKKYVKTMEDVINFIASDGIERTLL